MMTARWGLPWEALVSTHIPDAWRDFDEFVQAANLFFARCNGLGVCFLGWQATCRPILRRAA